MKNYFGELLGKGAYRHVYEFKGCPNLVIKHNVKRCKTYNQNNVEWEFWKAVQSTVYGAYFCPIINSINNGEFLICLRVERLKDKDAFRKIKLPFMKHDINRTGQWGIIGKNIVVTDYGDKKNLDLFQKHIRAK